MKALVKLLPQCSPIYSCYKKHVRLTFLKMTLREIAMKAEGRSRRVSPDTRRRKGFRKEQVVSGGWWCHEGWWDTVGKCPLLGDGERAEGWVWGVHTSRQRAHREEWGAGRGLRRLTRQEVVWACRCDNQMEPIAASHTADQKGADQVSWPTIPSLPLQAAELQHSKRVHLTHKRGV